MQAEQQGHGGGDGSCTRNSKWLSLGYWGGGRRKEEISGTRCTHFIMVPRKLAGYHSRT